MLSEDRFSKLKVSAMHASSGTMRLARNLIVEAVQHTLKAADLRPAMIKEAIINRAFCKAKKASSRRAVFTNGMRRC